MPLPEGTIRVTLGNELLAAVEAAARRTGQTKSQFVRITLARALGRGMLAEGVVRGRPRKQPGPKGKD